MNMETTPGVPEKRSIFTRVYAQFTRVIETFVTILMVCMVGLVFANVISRYFLNFSIAWSSEIARYIFIWLVLLGSILAFQNSEHLGLDLLPKVLPPKLGRLMLVITDVLVLYAICILIVGGWQYGIFTIESGWLSPAAGVPLGIVQILLPISAALLFVEGIGKLVVDIRGLAATFRAPKGVD
jgi:TRAP-type transport system small permease protein